MNAIITASNIKQPDTSLNQRRSSYLKGRSSIDEAGGKNLERQKREKATKLKTPLSPSMATYSLV